MSITPPPEAPERLTEEQRQAITKNRSNAFTPSPTSITIPMLDGAKNWDQWYNSLLGMCEMADIDGILTGDDPIPIAADKETATQFTNRCIYWKTANKYITGTIRGTLKPGGLAHIVGLSGAHQMVQKLRSSYKAKGYSSREVLWRQISRTSLDSCKDVTEWVETIRKAKTSLMELESSIPGWIITTTFLHGLPSSYDSFVEIILNSRGKDANGRMMEPDFEEVCEKVLDRERRQKVLAIDSNNTKALKAAANAANSNNNNNSNSRPRGKGKNSTRPKCEECGIPHGGDCYLAHPEKATQSWREKNKDRIAEFKKKKKADAKENKENKEKKEKACCAINTSTKDSGFFFDTAASLHYIYSKSWYEGDPKLLDEPAEVEACDGSTLYATHIGKIKLDILVTNDDGNDEECSLTIKDVYYCHEMSTNLISLGTLVRNGLSFGASKKRLTVTDDDGDTIMEGALIDTLFKLRLTDSDDSKARIMAKALVAKKSTDRRAPAKFWHETMGHLNYDDLAKLPKMVEGMQIIGPIRKEFCEPCALAKQRRTPSRSPMSKVDGPFHRIHVDLLGGKESLPRSIGGHKYGQTITDQATRHRWVDFLKKKEDALRYLKNFVQYVQVQFKTTIRIIRSDNGGEYDSQEAREWMTSMGIIQELTMPDSPEQNGIDERTNGILLSRARAQLIAAGLPDTLWAESFKTGIYVINRSPTSVLDKTPYEALHKAKPNLSRMHPFGLVCYAHDYKCKTRGKMAPRGFKCYFLGYEGTNQYRLWDGRKAQLVRRRDVIWGPFGGSQTSLNELNEASHDSQASGNDGVTIPIAPPNLNPYVEDSSELPQESSPELVQEIPDNEDSNDPDPVLTGQIPPTAVTPDQSGTGDPNLRQERLRHSTRNERKDYHELHHKGFAKVARGAAIMDGLDEPYTYKQAVNGPEREKWLQAMQSEWDSLKSNKTWKLVYPPPNRSILKGRWVFKKKLGVDGKVARYKARWVVKGFLQRQGIDYNETYSGVIKPITSNILLALAAKYDLEVDLVDIVTAFLYAGVKERILVEQPTGFEEEANKVCLLLKALYGLKQSPREWYETLSEFLIGLGFVRSQYDSCLFLFKSDQGILFVAVYVDDIQIVGHRPLVDWLKKELHDRFKTTDLGPCTYYLGMRMERNRARRIIKISQPGHIENVLNAHQMSEAKFQSSPMEPNANNTLVAAPEGFNANPDDVTAFKSGLGLLMYLMVRTRPDIAFALCKLSTFSNNPTDTHWQALKRVFRYLAGTRNRGIVYGGASNEALCGYTDADWAGDYDSAKSTSGYVFTLNGGAISWKSSKQKSMAKSTCEAEYMGQSDAAQEAVWARSLLSELGECLNDPTPIFGDNQGAIALAKNPIDHKRTRHINVSYHFVRELITNGTLTLTYIPTNEMIADGLTKALTPAKFAGFIKMLSLNDDEV